MPVHDHESWLERRTRICNKSHRVPARMNEEPNHSLDMMDVIDRATHGTLLGVSLATNSGA